MRVRTLRNWMIALSALSSAPCSATAAEPAKPAPVVRQRSPIPKVPIGFSNLVVRLEGRDEIGLAGSDFRIHLIERMRERGFSAVGAENIVFDKDESKRAVFLLGGVVRELECRNRSPWVRCRLGVEWQLLDVASDAVVYTALTRVAVLDLPYTESARMPSRLLLAALDSLLARNSFRDALAAGRSTPGLADAPQSAANFARCAPIGRKMPEAAEDVLGATVVVRTRTGHGSGFFVSSDGLVLTAAHVVDGPRVTLRLRTGSEIEAVPVRVARRTDVALLRVDRKTIATRCIATTDKAAPVGVGAELYVAGAPVKLELAFSLSRGIVSAIREFDGQKVLQTDAPVSPGHSGGPMVDAEGAVVAITNSKLAGRTVEGIAFGIPISTALAALGLTPAGSTDSALLNAAALAVDAPASVEPFRDKPDPFLSLDPEGDRMRADQAAREARDAAERAAREAARAEERRREALRDRATPGYVKAMKWGGLALGTVGAAVAFTSYQAYDEATTTRPEYNRLRIYNALGWGAFVLGAGSFTASFLLRPPLPDAPAAPAATARLNSWLSVGAGSVQWGGAF